MRRLSVVLLVLLLLSASLAPARAEEGCGGWFQPSCEELAEQKAERDAENSLIDRDNERFDQDRQNRLYDAAYAADEWADTYLSAEQAVALYWRNAYVHRDPPNGKRMGTLESTTTAEKVRYPCDTHYEDALSGGCVPADRDCDCSELRAWGIVNIPVRKSQSGNFVPSQVRDWMLLDDDHDDMAREYIPTNWRLSSR